MLLDYRRYQLTQTRTYERIHQPLAEQKQEEDENKFGPPPVNHDENAHLVFEYEFVLKVEDQQTPSDQNILAIHNQNNEDDNALMNNFSMLRFTTNEVLGNDYSRTIIQQYLVT